MNGFSKLSSPLNSYESVRTTSCEIEPYAYLMYLLTISEPL